MKRSFLPALLSLPCLLLGSGQPLLAQNPSLFQELGGFAIIASSDHPELPSPVGFGLASTWEFGGSFMARLSYHRLDDDTRKDGVVCDQYSQRINCRAEITETSVTLSGLRTAVMVRVPVGGMARLGAGGGVSLNHIKTEAIGTQSNLDADLLAPAAGIIGFSALFSAAVIPVSSLPLELTGGFGVHWVNFDTCSGNDPPQNDPYCGMQPMKEIELGLAFRF